MDRLLLIGAIAAGILILWTGINLLIVRGAQKRYNAKLKQGK